MSDAERAELELTQRKLAEREFYDFCHYVEPNYPEAAHLELLCEKLQQVERYVASGGEEGIGRLMVFMPPRHWKSSSCSVLFPPWFLGHLPEKRVILTSYGGNLAMGFSRRARNTIRSDRYRAVFGDRSGNPVVTLSDDSRSVENWDLEGHAGGASAAGVGGAITGKGAHLFIIDDPHKNRAEAESEATRRAVQQWWSADAQSRLEKGAAVVLILTRWHPDDLAGYLIKEMVDNEDADQWEILCLPAIAEPWAQEFDREEFVKALRAGWWRGVDPLGRAPGEPLWPEEFSLEMLESRKANTIGYDWVAIYAQRPRRLEGNLIKANAIQVIDAADVPPEVRWVRYWDLSVGRSERAHGLAGAKCGRDSQKRFYIADVRELRPPWSEARGSIVRAMLDDDAAVVQGIEVAGQQDGYYQDFRDDECLQLRSIVPVNPKEIGDKVARAQLWATRIEDKLVYQVRGPWNDAFIEQCVGFPNGVADDMVDAVSGAWQMLPGYVGWDDVPRGEPVASLFDLFGERAGAAAGADTGRADADRNPKTRGRPYGGERVGAWLP